MLNNGSKPSTHDSHPQWLWHAQSVLCIILFNNMVLSIVFSSIVNNLTVSTPASALCINC